VSVVIVAQYRIQPDDVAAVRAELEQMLEPTRAEPGCLAYDVYVDPNAETLVVLVERYSDEAAFQAHLDSAHFDEHLRQGVLPRLADRVRFDLRPLNE
jgi:quinol monooxygenase YgiN